MLTHRKAVKFGRSGGRARARKLTRKRRHEIAVSGGLARQLRARIKNEMLAPKSAQEEGRGATR
jgi:hypothetical protein